MVSSSLIKVHRVLMLNMDLVGHRWNLAPFKHQRTLNNSLKKVDQSSLQVNLITVVIAATEQQTVMLLVNNVVVLLCLQQELSLHPTH